ncbi:KDO2-lipid IV(A) lauroyltransferase [Atopomonas hussainii]|uniref:Lipid A biosynthesis acyltransferase n=1 Tax=Atopomonas hussainii TaxID=1429083 RepID=A0A1H7SXX3_9GAMM|nr:lipid A biosynthesis lauroyl acyltransferase [Atopomonas hussainii]SEL76814.1 KDO2-lipid IV(A) lauroyltransferase [Atopomonas hussainii]
MQRVQFKQHFLHPKHWPLWLGLGVGWLIAQLPYRLLLALGRVVGALMYRVAHDRRHIVETNLALCFPELSPAEREQLCRANFASTGMALAETAMAWWWPKTRLSSLAHVQGLEHLQQAAEAKQGVILMSLHFTTLELGAALLGQQATIDGMYREHDNPVFDYVQRRGRERHNLDAQAIERDDVRIMLKSLRQGRAVWYAPDQDYGRDHSIFVPLFGVPAATVTATSKFAKLGKAKVVPFVQHRRADGQGYDLTVFPALEDFPGASDEADCLRINQWIEAQIRQQPEQYLWAHRRFKTRPEGEARPYRKRKKR